MSTILKRTFFSTSLLTVSLFFSAPSFADDAAFPYLPRISLWGYSGDDTLGKGDLMAAFWGSEDRIAYVDIQGRYQFSQQDSMTSLGFGYRQMMDQARILGGYIFLDRNVSLEKHGFWFASPGLESLGNRWDFRLNGYIPINEKDKVGPTEFANNAGDFSFISFQQHSEFDHLFQMLEEVGPGIDGEIGWHVPHANGLEWYAGGYHFNMTHSSNINGIESRLVLPLPQHIALVVNDSYDNVQHNTIEAGIRLTFGGISDQIALSDLQSHLLDPIERNLSTLGQGAGVPVITTHKDLGEQLVKNNIWFFNPNGSTFVANNGYANCTAENPCNNFVQGTINGINNLAPNASLFFAPGLYGLGGQTLANGLPNITLAQVQLLNGQSMWGRSFDYKKPQLGATFAGAMQLPQGNNILDDVILDGENNSSFMNTATEIGSNNGVGLDIEANQVTLNNVVIENYAGASNNLGAGQNAIGVNINNSSGIYLNNVTITNITGGDSTSVAGSGFGISVGGNSNVSFVNTMISNIYGGNSVSDLGGPGFGIATGDQSNSNFVNTIINNVHGGSGINSGSNILDSGFGISMGDDSRANFINTIINNINGATSSTGGTAFGIALGDQSIAHFENTTISNIFGGSGHIGGMSFGIAMGDHSIARFENTSIHQVMGGNGSSSFSGSAFGIALGDHSIASFENTNISNINGGNGGSGGSIRNGEAFGIALGDHSIATFKNTNINYVKGGNGGNGSPNGDNGFGIEMVDHTNASFINTSINNISGGNGVAGGNGGNAFGIAKGSVASRGIFVNTVIGAITGGNCGTGGGTPGTAQAISGTGISGQLPFILGPIMNGHCF